MTVKEAAKEIGVSISMVYNLLNAGTIPYKQIGRRRLPLDKEVYAYIESATVTTAKVKPRTSTEAYWCQQWDTKVKLKKK